MHDVPRFTREQIRRRQRIALAVVAVLALVLVGGCTRLLVGALRSDDGAASPREPFTADDAAMSVPAVPEDAPARANLPEGIELAADEVIGIDVSSHQDAIDWPQVAGDGISFAYIKATEGTGYTDPRFAENWSGAQEAGITAGAYHYFTLCSPGAEQAEDFLAAAPPDDSALPPALDLEFDGACDERPEADHAQEEIDEFTAVIEEAWGRRLVIYSSAEWREHYGLPVQDGRPDWLFSEGERPAEPNWAVWQLRFDGTVAGISGGVDIDVARIEILRDRAEIEEGEGAITHDPEE